eukprot:1621806-Prymnesium_polylepis.1
MSSRVNLDQCSVTLTVSALWICGMVRACQSCITLHRSDCALTSGDVVQRSSPEGGVARCAPGFTSVRPPYYPTAL